MHKRTIFGVFLLLMAVSPCLYADPKITASLSESRIPQDQTALLTIQIDWPKSEGTYGFGVPEPDFENLSLVRRGESQEFFAREGQDWNRKTFELELKPLGPGKAEVREFTVTYVETAAQRQGSFQVSAMRLTVDKTVNPRSPVWIFAGGGVLFLILLSVLGISLARKKSKPAAEAPLTEEEKTGRRIQAMIEGRPVSKENFHLITAEFRQFLSDHYKTGQPQATEDEIIRILKSQNIPFEDWQKIKGLLERIQEAKYLPEPSAAGDYKNLQREILAFIESKKSLEPTL